LFILGGSYRPRGRGSSCKGDNCSPSAVVIVSIVGGIIALLFITVGVSIWIAKRRGRPSSPNDTFIQTKTSLNENSEKGKIDVFTSGGWKGKYYQYGRWHGPHQFCLFFDSQRMTVQGSGSDDVGGFTIDGVYSTETGRMGLTKTYKAGTGDIKENLGHKVTIQLTWNSKTNEFEGTWYVQTSKYNGRGAYKLQVDKSHILTVCDTV